MFEEVRKNKIRSLILISFFILLIGLLGTAIGWLYGNPYIGVTIAVVVAVIYTFFSFFSGGNMILSMTGAKEVKKADYPHLFHTVEGLALAAGIPVPKTYVIKDSALNAFATGRDPKHAAVTVTTGLLEKLERQELEGVIAHEMSHIKNYDVRLMMLTAVLVGIAVLLSDFLLRSFLFGAGGKKDSGNVGIVLIVVGLVLAVLTPVVGEIIKLAISRKREYMADANAAILTRYPPGLASALRKISEDPDPLVDKANKATAHLFISTPFRKKKGWISRLFATHPPIQDRIKRLDEM